MFGRKLFRLFILLGVIILIFAFTGCEQTAESSPDDNKDVPKVENNGENADLSNDQQTDEKDDWKKSFVENFEGDLAFRAYHYIQEPGYPWTYDIDVEIYNGNIYLNCARFEQSESCEPPALVFSDYFLDHIKEVDQANGNSEVADMLKKIKDSKSCYTLKQKSYGNYGQIYSETFFVYKIDNDYYFVSLNKAGNVQWIHRAIITKETGREGKWQELFIDNFPSIYNTDESISLKLYAQGNYSYVPSYEITIKNGDVYINGGLYKQSESSVPPEILYDPGLLSALDSSEQEKLEKLKKMQESTQCYILVPGYNPDSVNKIIVYRIGKIFYFLTCDTKGEYINRVYYFLDDK